MTLRAFARWRGVALSAVQRAIADDRLPTSVKTVRGRPVIVDPAKAAEEWAAHTRPRIDGPVAPSGKRVPSRYTTAKTRETEWRAKLAEIEYQRKTGELVARADYERAEAARIVAARTKLLGLPTRARQRLPHLTPADLAVLDAIVREALEELATGGAA